MAENKKLVNADNLQAVAKGVYEKTQSNLNTAKSDLDAKIVAEESARVAGDTFSIDMVTVKELGGIPANADLNGMSVQDVLKKLLYPHVKPVVGTVTVTPTPTVREHGNYQTVTTVSAPVTKKSNPIAKVELYHNTTLIDTIGDKNLDGEISSDEKSGTMTGTVTFGGLSEVTANGDTFTVKAYALKEDGSGYENVSSKSGTFTYVYPFYQGVMAAGTTVDGAMVTGLTKDVSSKGQKAYTYTTTQSHAVIAYPKSYGELKSILDPNNFENLAAFTKHEVQVTGLDGTAQAYYVYVSGASSVSGFKYTFKF